MREARGPDLRDALAQAVVERAEGAGGEVARPLLQEGVHEDLHRVARADLRRYLASTARRHSSVQDKDTIKGRWKECVGDTSRPAESFICVQGIQLARWAQWLFEGEGQ